MSQKPCASPNKQFTTTKVVTLLRNDPLLPAVANVCRAAGMHACAAGTHYYCMHTCPYLTPNRAYVSHHRAKRTRSTHHHRYTDLVPAEGSLLDCLASAVDKESGLPLADWQIAPQANTMILAGYGE